MVGTDNQSPTANGHGPGGRAGGIRATIKGPGFIFSSRRLWLLSVALYKSGHPRLAKTLKNFNSMLFHNSLPEEVTVSPDVRLGHQGFGTVLHPKVVIGRNVKIFHNVTMAVLPPRSPQQIVIEDDVEIGANAVLITRRNEGIRIGRGARVGAGAVVTRDVPPYTIAISAPVQLRPRKGAGAAIGEQDGAGDPASAAPSPSAEAD